MQALEHSRPCEGIGNHVNLRILMAALKVIEAYEGGLRNKAPHGNSAVP